MQGGLLDPDVAESGDTGAASRQGCGCGRLALRYRARAGHPFKLLCRKSPVNRGRPAPGAVSIGCVHIPRVEQQVRVDSPSGWVPRSLVVLAGGDLAGAGAAFRPRRGQRLLQSLEGCRLASGFPS